MNQLDVRVSILEVLMVTGTFLPNINRAVLQSSQIMERLRNECEFEVLTDASGQTLPASSGQVLVHKPISVNDYR